MVLKVIDKSVQILLESLVLVLSLYIRLRMVYGTKASIDAQVMAEGCLELRGELGPAIRNDDLRYVSSS